MIVKCQKCKASYDDAFRVTICPHNTFLANDGDNNFNHHPKSYISTDWNTNIDYRANNTVDKIV